MNVPSLNGRFITEEGKMELDGIRSLGVSPVTQFEYGIDEDSGCITRRRPDGPWCWEGPSLAWFELDKPHLGAVTRRRLRDARSGIAERRARCRSLFSRVFDCLLLRWESFE